MDRNIRRAITPADYPNIENVVKKAVKEKQNFERLELPKEALLEMFAVSSQLGTKQMRDQQPNIVIPYPMLSTTGTSNIISKTKYPTVPRPPSTDADL
jgi:threonyl-tRNA synthetase